MDTLDAVLTQMDLNFLGSGQHKILAPALLSDPNALLLDVRTAEEAATVKLDFIYHLTTLHIPLHCLPERFAAVPTDRVVGIFCPQSVRASIAYTYLRAHGYTKVYVFEGGYAALVDEARPGKILAQMKRGEAKD
ncbi:MAG: rhodanese-like domain-containing protein [Desulfuromonas sp.]|nr:rhodanese-like domain-containing protein [Desulfuromonas sp.]